MASSLQAANWIPTYLKVFEASRGFVVTVTVRNTVYEKMSKPTASDALKPLVFVTWHWKELCRLHSSIPCSAWPNGCAPICNLLLYNYWLWWHHDTDTLFSLLSLLWESAFRMWVPLRLCQWCGALMLACTICWTNSLLSGDLRCHDAHLTCLWYNAVTYISLISNAFKWYCCPPSESLGPYL